MLILIQKKKLLKKKIMMMMDGLKLKVKRIKNNEINILFEFFKIILFDKLYLILFMNFIT